MIRSIKFLRCYVTEEKGAGFRRLLQGGREGPLVSEIGMLEFIVRLIVFLYYLNKLVRKSTASDLSSVYRCLG